MKKVILGLALLFSSASFSQQIIIGNGGVSIGFGGGYYYGGTGYYGGVTTYPGYHYRPPAYYRPPFYTYGGYYGPVYRPAPGYYYGRPVWRGRRW